MGIFSKIVALFLFGIISLALTLTFGVNYFVRDSLDREARRTLSVKQHAFDSSIQDLLLISSNAANSISKQKTS